MGDPLEDLETALAHPDPDPDELPDAPPGYPLADERALIHLARAVLRYEGDVAKLAARRKLEIEAWDHLIAAADAKAKSWRLCIRDYLQRHGAQKVQTPEFTVSYQSGRTKIVLTDEQAARDTLMASFAGSALETVVRIIKKDFDALYNAQPKAFAHCAEEVQGEPGIRITRRETR